jgi:hypothetical protein
MTRVQGETRETTENHFAIVDHAFLDALYVGNRDILLDVGAHQAETVWYDGHF